MYSLKIQRHLGCQDSGGKKEAVTRSGLGLIGYPNFEHSFCQSSSHCFCMFSKLRTIV